MSTPEYGIDPVTLPRLAAATVAAERTLADARRRILACAEAAGSPAPLPSGALADGATLLRDHGRAMATALARLSWDDTLVQLQSSVGPVALGPVLGNPLEAMAAAASAATAIREGAYEQAIQVLDTWRGNSLFAGSLLERLTAAEIAAVTYQAHRDIGGRHIDRLLADGLPAPRPTVDAYDRAVHGGSAALAVTYRLSGCLAAGLTSGTYGTTFGQLHDAVTNTYTPPTDHRVGESLALLFRGPTRLPAPFVAGAIGVLQPYLSIRTAAVEHPTPETLAEPYSPLSHAFAAAARDPEAAALVLATTDIAALLHSVSNVPAVERSMSALIRQGTAQGVPGSAAASRSLFTMADVIDGDVAPQTLAAMADAVAANFEELVPLAKPVKSSDELARDQVATFRFLEMVAASQSGWDVVTDSLRSWVAQSAADAATLPTIDRARIEQLAEVGGVLTAAGYRADVSLTQRDEARAAVGATVMNRVLDAATAMAPLGGVATTVVGGAALGALGDALTSNLYPSGRRDEADELTHHKTAGREDTLVAVLDGTSRSGRLDGLDLAPEVLAPFTDDDTTPTMDDRVALYEVVSDAVDERLAHIGGEALLTTVVAEHDLAFEHFEAVRDRSGSD